MTDLTPIVTALAALISTGYSVVTGNLTAFFNLLAPLVALKNVDFGQLKNDLEGLSEADRATLEAQFDAGISIPTDPEFAQELAQSADALNNAVTIAQALVLQYNAIQILAAQIKAIFTKTSESFHKLGLKSPVMKASVPTWLANAMPAWFPSWLLPLILNAVTGVVLPALEVAFPGEAILIQEIGVFLTTGVASKRLQACHGIFHGQAPKMRRTLKGYDLDV